MHAQVASAMRAKVRLLSAAPAVGLHQCPQRTTSNLHFSVKLFSTTSAAYLRQRPQNDHVLPRAGDAAPVPAGIDPHTVTMPSKERELLRSRTFPIGSRRRRAALQSSQGIPFERLPYQCFQEARKVIQEDRAEKVAQIGEMRTRIERLRARLESETDTQKIWETENRLRSMKRRLEHLKILADANDPLVKKRHEDGMGDMTRPIYRHLAHKKWSSYKALVLQQRINQMYLVPDILPSLTPTADISTYFHGYKGEQGKRVLPRPAVLAGLPESGHRVVAQPGEYVASLVCERPPQFDVQVYDAGERLVTIAIVDCDVPNPVTDLFDTHCHFLAVNIPLSPTQTTIRLSALSSTDQTILPYTAPISQKGSPYHRLAVFILEQQNRTNKADRMGAWIPTTALKEQVTDRDSFSVQGFVARNGLKPVTATLWRIEWDEWMDAVMERAGVAVALRESVLKRKRVEPLPYRWKPKWSERYR